MRRPEIKTDLPGPKAARLIQRDQALLSPSLPREYPLALDKGQGVWIEDPDGNIFLDFTSRSAVTNTGHCHPRVVEAAKNQVEAVGDVRDLGLMQAVELVKDRETKVQAPELRDRVIRELAG